MKQKFSIAMSLAVILAMLFTSVGLASDLSLAVVDATAPTGSVTLNPSQSGAITINFSVTGRQDNAASFDVNTTWTITGNAVIGSNPVTFSVPARSAQAAPTTFSTTGTVKVDAGQGAGTFTVSVGAFNISSTGQGKLSAGTPSTYEVIVELPTVADTAAPNLTCTPPSDVVWYGSNVTVPCTASDSESGLLNSSDASFSLVTSVASGYENATVSTNTHQVCDNANNCAVAGPYTFMVDMKAPTISAAATTTPNVAGWYSTDVTIHFTCSDSGSGIPVGACPADQTLSAEGTAVASTTQTVTDAVGNVSVSSNVVTVQIDKTKPGIVSAVPLTSAWYNADVTANWSCSDALSGPVNASVSALASGEGSAVPATGICADNAGNTASDTQYFKIDKTGPGIVANATKSDNSAYTADTWTNLDVAVDFVCSDEDGSGVASCLGDAAYNTEGIFNASGSATDNVGNSSSASFGPIKIDKTAPTISGAPTTSANGNGWYNGDVTIHWTCSDTLSGLSGSCPADSVITGEGDNLSVNASVSDMAGNTANATVSGIKIDRTAPSASASASPAVNAYGWNNSDVTVSFSGSDILSDIDFCDAAVVLSSEGANQSASGTCTDKAGNVSAPAMASGINIDKSAPVASATASPAPNANGWNNADVTVSFSGTDGLSGVAGCDAAVVLSSEGANQSASGTCTDKAGNVSAAASASASIDKTAPVVALVGGPANGSTYYFGFVPAAPTCSATDGLSGLDGDCVVDGYNNAVGSYTVTATSTDKAGNSATASASYMVLGWRINGFFQPVDMGKVYNSAKNGSTVPLKFEVFAGSTELTSVSFIKNTFVQTLTCGTGVAVDDIENYATGGTSLRYDTTGGQFIFNWQTPKTPSACYRVTLTTADGASIFADFKLK